jgi:hypothetical protein
MNRKAAFLLGSAAGAFVLSNPALASETTVYSYDALGRLVAATTSGGPNHGLGAAIGYDPAGNRSSYSVGGSSGAPPPAPPPSPPPAQPPPPPSPNQPPVTAPDALSVPQCSTGARDVLANDSDPEGNYPLALVGVTQGNKGAATIVGTTTIQFEAGFATGGSILTYTVRDSLGATSTGTLGIEVTSGSCN